MTTGLSRYGRNLLRSLQDIGTDVTVLNPKPQIPTVISNFTRRFGMDLERFLLTYPIRVPKAREGTIIHLTSQNQASGIIARKQSTYIVTVHDLITLTHRKQQEVTGYMTFYDKLFDDLAARGLKRARAIIADSESTRDDILRFLNFPEEKIDVIPLGVNHARFNFNDNCNTLDAISGANHPESKLILNVGSEDPRKNLRRVFQAFANLLPEMPTLRLIRVGSARFFEERKRLEAHAHGLGIADKITFLEQITDTQLAQYYRAADILLFPSLYEGFGLPVLEAMACGTPVITSNTSSLPEVAGDAAILVDPENVEAIAEAMRRVLAGPALAQELRAKGLERAKQFTWERCARETIAVYEKVLGQKLTD